MAELNLSTSQPLNASAFAKLIAFLSGKKTYLVGLAGLIYAIGIGRGWWPNDATIWGALGCTGGMTIRAAIAKLIIQIRQSAIGNLQSEIPDAPAEAARRIAGPGVPAIILAASLFFITGSAKAKEGRNLETTKPGSGILTSWLPGFLIVFCLLFSGCSATNTAAIAQHFAASPAGSAIVAKASNTVIDQGLNAGATRIDTGNPYLHAVADGIRANEGKVLTAGDVQKIVTDFGDPANAHKFKTLGVDVWNVISSAVGSIGWSAAEELAAQTLQNSALNPTPPSP